MLPRSVSRRTRVGLSPCLIPAAVIILYCCSMHQVSVTKCHNVGGSLHASLHWAALWGRVSGCLHARPCCVASLAWAACPPLLTPRPSHPWHRDQTQTSQGQSTPCRIFEEKKRSLQRFYFYKELLLARNFRKVFQVIFSRDKWLDLNIPSPPSILAKLNKG